VSLLPDADLNLIPESFRPLCLTAKKVGKVWGTEWWVYNGPYCFKLLVINPGFQCSLHLHPTKTETFIVASGEVFLEQRDVRAFPYSEILREGCIRHIEPKTPHRFGSTEGAVIFEISTHHEDSDVVRLEESKKICETPEKS
jgi:mannose-6-phosphate isomerase-like protein (cupin superfamily)